MNREEWKKFEEEDPRGCFNAAREWLLTPGHEYKCSQCPNNIESDSWPGTRLMCGQFHCEVALATGKDKANQRPW